MFTFRRRPRQNYGLYLLAVQLFSARYIPPTTLSAILLQIAIFLEAMCLLPSRVLYRSEWLRMLA
ncbi:unnamed protein product, partial [Gongylonema pulchrum]|uniref:Very-long-chain (3R)-3-hydroxyacyl-CoA dehydratase n=1 Tax=Gongylonema pulchrum TaxID=637853 RepID=A0A183EQS3_9BILA